MVPGERQVAAQALPVSGQVIAGKYAVVKVIGEGGMGVVFEATHLRLRQRVAVKMLLPEMLAHEIIVTRFEREARASGQLRNRHAARVMDVDVTPEGLPYMVMEFLEGHDLQVELDRRGRLRVDEAVDYLLQTCSAMIEAHQLGIVHRDLKPANLFLALDGDTGTSIVKVLDFGISKVQAEGDVKLTVADSVMGTAMYMSPEQVRSSVGVDARSDIWSLGIILYELLSGRPPWLGSPTQLAAAVVSEDAPDVRSMQADVPMEIAAVIKKALWRDPAERYADVKQLATALAPFAPLNGAGRILADALLRGSNGMLPRVSIRPAPLEEARTLIQAAAVSESRMGDGAGTAPGWSQPSHPTTRARTVLLGFLAAFAIGLVVVGGIAMVWLRSGAASAARDRAAAASASSAGHPPASAGIATSPADPLPLGIALDPAPPATAEGPRAPAVASLTSPRARPPLARSPASSRAPAAPPPAAPPPVAPPAVAPPAPPPAKPAAPSGNPLLL